MLTKIEYQNRINELLEKADAIDDKATHENRDLHGEELILKNDLLDKVVTYKAYVDTIDRQDRIKASVNTADEPLTQPKRTPRIEMGQDRESLQTFNSFGQQLHAIMRAGLPGGSVDKRLYNATGLNETVPSDGGFLVQTDFSTEMLNLVWQTGKIAPLCKRITVSGNSNGTKINGVDETSRATGSRYGGIRGYWAGEADEKTASKPKFRQIELNLKKLVGLCYATDENLDDAAQLEGIIRQGFASEFGFLIDDAIINGTGAGQPLGVLNSGALVQANGVSGQSTTGVIAENIIEMWGSLFANSRTNAVWLVNQEVEMALMTMHLAPTTSGAKTPLFMPPGGLSQSPYGTIFGRPVMPIEQCQAIGTVGDIVLADFSNGYVLAEKGGMKSDMSIHVRFVYDESVFRFVLRIDGQPVRSKSLTPYKGSAAQSHFVALRSGREA